MRNNRILIALGGAGIKSLARLKAKIYAEYSDKSLFEQENTFIFIDTDQLDVQKLNQDASFLELFGGKPVIGLNEFISLGYAIPFAIREAAIDFHGKENEHLKSWCIMPGEGKYTPQNSLNDGAGAMRMDGRLALFKSQHIVIAAIEQAIIKLKTMRPDLDSFGSFDVSAHAPIKFPGIQAPQLWVISATNGGTGSAIALDVLFILDRLYYKYLKCEPIKKLALIAPEAFVSLPENISITQYSLNSFAFMWELNALKMSSDKEGLMSKLFVSDYFDNHIDSNLEPFDPYSYAIMFDAESSSNGVKLSLNNVFDNVASVLYKLTSSSSQIIDTLILNLLARLDGTIRDNTEWSKSIVATGGKAIEKPNADLKDYLKTRFYYDIFAYGIFGPEFNEVHSDAEKAETVKNIIKGNILLYLNNNIQVAEKPNLERDILSALSNITMSPQPAKGTFGGYKEDGILSTYSTTFCNGIEEELNLFAQSFEKTGILINSKENYLNEIKGTIRKTLNNLVCEYGLNYVKGLVYSIDFELEKNILPNLDKTISEEYSADLEVASKSEIDKISSNNKDYASLLMATEKWKEFKINRFIIQQKTKILHALCKEGYLDTLLSANGNSKGLGPLITNFSKQKNAIETEFLNLAKSFLSKSNENPFITYFPLLSEMIGGAGSQSGWKRNSEFENLYSSMVSLNKDERNIKGSDMMGTPPARSKKSGKDKSLEFHFEELLKLMGEYNGSYFIDFAEQNDFDRGAKSVTSFMKSVEEYLDKLIIQTDPVNDWLNKNDLVQIFKRFEDSSTENKKLVTSFKARFNFIPVFYPSDAIVSSVYYIYSFPDELLELAKSIGYDTDDKQKFHNRTDNTSKLEVLAFETGHSFDTYSYFKNYANTYQEKRKEILSLDYGCHIHKGFVHLNMDKALQGEKSLLLEFAFYDAMFSLMKIKNKELFNSLFYEEDIENDPFSIELPLKLPLLKIDSSENNRTVVFKYLLFDKNVNKLKIYMAGHEKIHYSKNFASFYAKTSTLNRVFSISLSALNEWIKSNESFIQSNFLAENWTDFIKLVAEKLSIPSMHERTFADMVTIRQLKTQIEELRTNLVL